MTVRDREVSDHKISRLSTDNQQDNEINYTQQKQEYTVVGTVNHSTS
jgi:hypothetical protein